MAKFSISGDTSTGELTVTLDGNNIQNVSSVSISPMEAYAKDEDDKIYFRVSTYEKSESGDVAKMTDYVCCNNKLEPAVANDICKFLKKQ